jgi:small subunit ribosomal protein S3
VGQKTHPIGFRLGFTKTWNAKWFANKKNYPVLLKEDIGIRNAIRGRLRDAAIARIDIERSANQVTVTIQTAKPGVVIGKGGAKVEELRQVLGKMTGKMVKVNIFEIRYPELDAYLIAENVAQQLERRVSFRKVLKQTVQRSMKSGAKGVRVAVSGRLGGAEMSRREWEREGRVPLHTLRGDIEFGRAIAKTTYGTIGVRARSSPLRARSHSRARPPRRHRAHRFSHQFPHQFPRHPRRRGPPKCSSQSGSSTASSSAAA